MRKHADVTLAALVVGSLFVIGLFVAGEPAIDASLVTVPTPGTAGHGTSTTVTTPPTSTVLPPVSQVGGTLAPPAERLGNAIQATDTLPPPSTVPVPDWARCPQWWQLAADVGWPVDELWHLDRIMWGESRCREDSWVSDHDDYGGGLLGINVMPGIGTRSFVGPLVDWDWSRLLDAETNLTVGLAYVAEAESHGWCKWRPWTTRDRSVCG